MSTTIDALRNLGLKVNGTEPISNYTGNIINEIAENYEGGGSGAGIYTFDFSSATEISSDEGITTYTLSITSTQANELSDQAAIDLILPDDLLGILMTDKLTVTRGYAGFVGGAIVDENNLITANLLITSSTAMLNVVTTSLSSGGGTQLYKHTLSNVTVTMGEDSGTCNIEVISTANAAPTTVAGYAALMNDALKITYIIGPGVMDYYLNAIATYTTDGDGGTVEFQSCAASATDGTLSTLQTGYTNMTGLDTVTSL